MTEPVLVLLPDCCGGCRFIHPKAAITAGWAGMVFPCRRFPVEVAKTRHDWCGEYEPRPAPKTLVRFLKGDQHPRWLDDLL